MKPFFFFSLKQKWGVWTLKMWENCMCFSCFVWLFVCLAFFFFSIHESHTGSVAFFFFLQDTWATEVSHLRDLLLQILLYLHIHSELAREWEPSQNTQFTYVFYTSPTHSLQVILYNILLQAHFDHLSHMRSSVECSIHSDMSALKSWRSWSTLDPNIKDAVNWALIYACLGSLSLKHSFHCLLPGYLLAPAGEGRQDLEAKLHTWEVLILCPNFV